MTAAREGDERAVGLQKPQHGGPGLEEHDHALDDALTHVARVEALGEAPGQTRQLFRLEPAARHLRIEPSVLEREGGLVGERLRQSDLVVVELSADPIADTQSADHAVADAQRHAEHRPMPGALDHGSRSRREREPRVREQIRRGDRDPLVDGEAHDRVTAREHRTQAHRDAGLARDGEGDERIGLGVEPVEGRGMRTEQPPHAVGHSLRDEIEIERL